MRWYLAAILIAGCATGQPAGKGAAPADRLVQGPAGCAYASAGADGSGAVVSTLQQAGLLGLYLALRGAAEGAWWGAVTGGSAADGAWIGSVAGAGVGTIIGVAVGVKNGLQAHRRHLAWSPSCGELVPGSRPTHGEQVTETEEAMR
jgi:hypothetical protein